MTRNILQAIKTNRRLLLMHVLAWVLLIVYHSVTDYLNDPASLRAMDTLIVHLFIYIPAFYYTYYLVFRFYGARKNIFLMILLAAVCAFISIMSSYLTVRNIIPAFSGEKTGYKPEDILFNRNFIFTSLDYYVRNPFIYAMLYWYATHTLKVEKRVREIEVEKLKLRYEQLRAQVNPHFLYNTLNFFYARTVKSEPEVAEGIEKLTGILRYSLQSGNPLDDKVLLSEEIEQVDSLIELHQLRYRQSLHINFERTGEMQKLRILPHILITLVENALKYGAITIAETPVQIKLEINGNKILFTTVNQIRESLDNTSISSGIGLNNIRLRLEQVYPGKHKFSTSQENQVFTASLEMEL